ncbi:hypothetical protein FQN55_005757 [Onygenales sp. PD_40]|nr:hypothetical protein FQN55_005757 [Onygenales sp. PD_40]KAK2788355.1 hypothetical protein FQN52_006679 [Onygenales sp. PD_12]
MATSDVASDMEILLEDSRPHYFPDKSRRREFSLASPKSSAAVYRLRRFHARGLIAVFAPAAVTIYFILLSWMVIDREHDAVKYGYPGEIWLFYSWFVVGVFSLSLSRYGFMGVEASMLQERFWQAENAMVLMMHSGATWSGPGGWLKVSSQLYSSRKSLATGRLWYTLAFLSLMPSLALPLSGLCMEVRDGYVRLRSRPMVIGHNFETFNQRSYYQTRLRGLPMWKAGTRPSLPGIGILYTPSYIQRTDFDGLRTLPNVLPLHNKTPDLFLVPQAEAPFSGNAWGLLIGYNCSIVRSVSEFTILNKRPFARRYKSWQVPGTTAFHELNDDGPITFKSDMDEIIQGWDTSNLFGHSLWSYSEIGTSMTNAPSMYSDQAPYEIADILEYAIWQIRHPKPEEHKFDFNETIEQPIDGMGHPFITTSNGTLALNSSFFSFRDGDTFLNKTLPLPKSIAPPIGVRCIRYSSLGTANLNPDGSYTSFTETSVPEWGLSEFSAHVFGLSAAAFLGGTYTDLFTASNSPSPVTVGGDTYYFNFLQARQLLEAVSLAHAVDALQLMYDGVTTFGAAWDHLNTTSSRPSKILDTGVLLPIIPAIPLIIWALGSAILGAMYGFRRRWAETLDGYCLFRFGADFSKQISDNPDFSGIEPFYKSRGLKRLPGLIGDSRPKMDIGHISLVNRGGEVNKMKPFS